MPSSTFSSSSKFIITPHYKLSIVNVAEIQICIGISAVSFLVFKAQRYPNTIMMHIQWIKVT